MYQYVVVISKEIDSITAKFPVAGYCDGTNLSLGRVVLKGAAAQRITSCRLISHRKPQLNQRLSVTRKGEQAIIDIPALPLGDNGVSFELMGETTAKQSVSLLSCACEKSYRPSHVIFVVGSPRSGTTAVGNAIQRAFDTTVHGESHLSEIIGSLAEHAEKALLDSPAKPIDGMLVNEITLADIQMSIIKMMHRIHHQFYGDYLILDKTPGGPNIRALWLMLRAYPDGKVIYCKRRGIENVISRLTKFPGVDFEGHCKQWRQNFIVWEQAVRLNTRELGHSDWHTDVEQLRLASRPEDVLNELSVWLAMTEEQKARALEYLTFQSPQKTSDYKRALDLDSVDWTNEQKVKFKLICGEQMKRQGYSYTSDYYL